MDNYQNWFDRISLLTGVAIFRLENNVLKEYRQNGEDNPLVKCIKFQNMLIDMADRQEIPVIYQDVHQVFWGCIKNETENLLIGPMSIQRLSGMELRRYYRDYGISNSMEKQIPKFTFSQILAFMQLLSQTFLKKEYPEHMLVQENHLTEYLTDNINEEQIIFKIEDEKRESAHHTYMEERKLLECVRKGDVEAALRQNLELDTAMGRLSTKEWNHWKNLLIVAVTLCTRAAIEGGLPPAEAYMISDFYIQKSEKCMDISSLSALKNQAVRELTEKVREKNQVCPISNHIERCKDYISKHYKEKIYLKDMAQVLGLSSTYLSRLFAKETGMCLQDYINRFKIERAANLLIYSEESISAIAEYVNFPNQSYFGKIFKKQKQMTPLEYRNRYKMAEFHADQEEILKIKTKKE